jgi:bacterioferritin-associated ferredoxin
MRRRDIRSRLNRSGAANLQTSCNVVRICYNGIRPDQGAGAFVYVCNCNGIRERQVREAVQAGARRPADIFKACGVRPQCARCVCDMREILQDQGEALRYAAE